MRRFAITVAALAVTVVPSTASSAASPTRPNPPKPADFELPASATRPTPAAVVGTSAARVEYRSPELRAPGRFNLAGLRWKSGGEPELRARFRKAGGRWSRWVALQAHDDHGPDPGSGERTRGGVSDPFWAGEADYVQYRSSRALREARIHFVRTLGSVPAGGAKARPAQNGRPSIVSRSAWGASDCTPRRTAGYGQIKAMLVHHTVNANTYSRAQAPALVLAICRYHRNSNGWDDVGYNFLVDRFGTIYEGRAGGVERPVIGSQAAGHNSSTTSISNIGTYDAVPQADAVLQAQASLIRWKLALHGVPSQGRVSVTSSSGVTRAIERISGHRDVNATGCPGDSLYAQLPMIRRLVGGESVTMAPSTKLELRLATKRVRYPNSTTAVGRLLAPDGTPIAGRTVKIEASKRGRFTKVATRTTASDGRFSATFKPAGRRGLRARFVGGGGYAAATSVAPTVQVRPKIEASLATRRLRTGAKIVVSGRVGPAKSTVRVVIHRLTGPGSPKRVARLRVKTVKQGRLRGLWSPGKPGKYSVQVVSPTDGDTLQAASPKMQLTVTGGGGASR